VTRRHGLTPVRNSYQLVLSALNALKSQKVQVERDLPKLETQRDAALANPTRFIASLMSKTNEPVPKRQKVVRIPSVALEKYGLTVEQLGIEPSTPHLGFPQLPLDPFRAMNYTSEASKAIQPPRSPLWMPRGLATFDHLAATAFRSGLPPDPRVESPSAESGRSDSPISPFPEHPPPPILDPAPPPRGVGRISGALYQQKSGIPIELVSHAPITPADSPNNGDMRTEASATESATAVEESVHADTATAASSVSAEVAAPIVPVVVPLTKAQAAAERRKESKAAAAAAASVEHVAVICDSCRQEPLKGPRLTCLECAEKGIQVDLCTTCEKKGFVNGESAVG
jgi:hypothetical protein